MITNPMQAKTELQNSRASAKSALLDYAGMLRLLKYPLEEIVRELRAVTQEAVVMTIPIVYTGENMTTVLRSRCWLVDEADNMPCPVTKKICRLRSDQCPARCEVVRRLMKKAGEFP